MATLTVVLWRDIPAQVIVANGRRNQIKRLLPDRFQKAIDAAAMRGDASDTDSYLSAWRRTDPVPVSGDSEKILTEKIAEIEADWDRERLNSAVRSGGFDLT